MAKATLHDVNPSDLRMKRLRPLTDDQRISATRESFREHLRYFDYGEKRINACIEVADANHHDWLSGRFPAGPVPLPKETRGKVKVAPLNPKSTVKAAKTAAEAIVTNLDDL